MWSGECGMWSGECVSEVWSVVGSVKCGVWSGECEVRSAKCGGGKCEVWSVKWRERDVWSQNICSKTCVQKTVCADSKLTLAMWSVECGVVRSVECGAESLKCGM